MSELGDCNSIRRQKKAVERQDEYDKDPSSAMRKDATAFREGAKEDFSKAKDFSDKGDETTADVYRERGTLQDRHADELERDADRLDKEAAEQTTQDADDNKLNQGEKEFGAAKSIEIGR